MDINTNTDRRVLIVDDELAFLTMLQKVVLKKCNCIVELADSAEAALVKIQQWQPAVVVSDIMMEDMTGLELLTRIRELDTTITPIIMTGYGTIEMAVKALKDGAYDFHEKPFDNDKIIGSIQRALERTKLIRENRKLQQQLSTPAQNTGFVGKSVKMRETLDLISRVAATNATVLIRGESGTGKEVAAQTIHQLSDRADKRMITINCPAVPEHILESELFGYVKGAFTGAENDKDGLFLDADGSTILLDEIADIPVSVQTKLLRVLQEKEIQPLGQTSTIKVDVRVIASTNQNLEKKMEKGEFREDLFYRLNVMPIHLPALKELGDDILVLANHFLKEFKTEYDRENLQFSTEALQYLMGRTWKGNVRQLKNTINRATFLCKSDQIEPEDLDPDRKEVDYTMPAAIQIDYFFSDDYKTAKEKTLQRFTRAYLLNALEKNMGNISAAARESGIDRQGFQRLMRKYKVCAEGFREN